MSGVFPPLLSLTPGTGPRSYPFATGGQEKTTRVGGGGPRESLEYFRRNRVGPSTGPEVTPLPRPQTRPKGRKRYRGEGERGVTPIFNLSLFWEPRAYHPPLWSGDTYNRGAL